MFVELRELPCSGAIRRQNCYRQTFAWDRSVKEKKMAQQDEKALNREEKLKALEAAIVKLEKDYGKGAVMKLGDPEPA